MARLYSTEKIEKLSYQQSRLYLYIGCIPQRQRSYKVEGKGMMFEP